MNKDKEQRIREEAYHIWVAEGRPDGRHEEHWRKARALVSKAAASPKLPKAKAKGVAKAASDKKRAVRKKTGGARRAAPRGNGAKPSPPSGDNEAR